MVTRTHIGKRGTVVIPVALRRRYHLEEGALVALEELSGGLLLKAVPVGPSAAERRRFFEQLSEQVSATRAEAGTWAEEAAERAALAGTLLDGLTERGEAADA